MEYEQVEYGRRIVMEAITRQDINAYHDLLSPEVLLVTHFPYPTSSSDSNVQAIQQWVHMSQQRDASTTTSGGGGQRAAAATFTKSGTAASQPVVVGGSRRRAKELLTEQERHRDRQQKRYEAFRKRREGHHGTTTEDEAAAEGSGGVEAAGRQPTVDPVQPPNSGSGTASKKGGGKATEGESTRRKELSGKSTAISTTGNGSGGVAARVPVGVRWFHQQQQPRAGHGGSPSLQQQQQQQRSPAMPGRVSTTQGQTSLAAAAAAAAATTATTAAGDNAALAYEDVVDIAEGRLLVSFRFFQLLHWVSSNKDVANIAPVEVDLQLRKDILQEDEVLPLPPAPTNIVEQYEQLGLQYTERNQPLSCITVIWGRDYLLFRDRIFFDDGLIVTVHRTMLSIPEVVTRSVPPPSWSPQQQQRVSDRKQAANRTATTLAGRVQSQAVTQAELAYKAVDSFYGVSASRVNTLNTSWPLLDFSFLDAAEPSALLRLAPASGHVHIGKPPRAAADPRLAQGVFLNQNNDPSTATANPAARTLIKAKNKRGEEEAYEFNDNRHHLSVFQQQDGAEGGEGEGDDWGPPVQGKGKGRGEAGGTSGGGVAAVRAQRYDAACVRVSGCHLHAKMDQLLPVLRRLIVNSLLTLHTLDLSQNTISMLPDLRLLPLQSLKLHDNAISDWRVVEQQIAPLPYLTVLTLHGNPIAEERELTRSAAATNITTATTTHGATKHGKSKTSAAVATAAAAAAAATCESPYWKRLLALLLSHPSRVAPLRQVDFVTLTAQDFNLAGAHALFTTGKADVLNRARTMNAGTTRNGSGTRMAATAATAAGGGVT